MVWVFINRYLNQGEDCWKINSATMFTTLIKVCFMLFLALIEIQLRGLGESPLPVQSDLWVFHTNVKKEKKQKDGELLLNMKHSKCTCLDIFLS